MKRFIKKITSKVKSNLNLILLVLSMIILVYFCLINNNLIRLLKTLPLLNIYWLIGGVISLLLSWFFESKVLSILFFCLNGSKCPKMFFYKVIFCAEYFAAITPMGIGAQPAQISKLKEKGITAKNSVIILTKKFLIYQSTALFYSVISAILYFSKVKCVCPEIFLFIIIGLLCQGFLTLFVFIFSVNKKVTYQLIKFATNALFKIKIIKNPEKTISLLTDKVTAVIKSNIKLDKKTNAKLYLLSFLQITFLFSIPFFVFKSFNHTSNPIFEIICTQSITNTISSFNPLPGASGVAEEGFLKLFSAIFAYREIAVAMLLCRFITFYFIILIGMLFYKKLNGKT